ncbi:hypothetical protein DPMN_185671 [Dreissena polymorpha]|uniref:Uncharacterized protein n=1 Tax=Dreissena polymorpha TaxID=45954 RepID=A0A9D4DMC0_DREPO|nr:hypothetical protein DPMN_185671 [Dreissena polymorpha]
MQDESTNLEQTKQGFSNELYVIQVQQTRKNVPHRMPLYFQLPPPYDPAWAPTN